MNDFIKNTADRILSAIPGCHLISGSASLCVKTDTDSYTIVIGDPVEVLNSDGDPLKMIFETVDDAVDYVINVLKPQAAS